jgi:hypothetical protein
MDTSNLIYGLALFTLLAVIAFGIWQYFRTRSAIAHHEHSTVPPHEGVTRKPHSEL